MKFKCVVSLCAYFLKLEIPAASEKIIRLLFHCLLCSMAAIFYELSWQICFDFSSSIFLFQLLTCMFTMATENKDTRRKELVSSGYYNIITCHKSTSLLGRFEVKSLVSFTLASEHDLSYTMILTLTALQSR